MLTKEPKRKKGAVDKELEIRQKSGMQSLFMMFMGAVLAVMIGVFFYLSPFFNQKTTAPLNAPVQVVPLEQANEQAQYEFYEVLPEQEFRSIPEGVGVQDEPETLELKVDEVVRPAPAPAETADEIVVVEENETYDAPSMSIQRSNDTTYILQIRSYDNAAEADSRLGEVMMTGVDAEVVKRSDGAGGILYQVVSTPFVSRDAAMVAYGRLQSNGIDAVVIEQKR